MKNYFLAAALAALPTCGTAPTSRPEATSWRTVVKISGTGNRTSPPFDLPNKECRVLWWLHDDPAGGGMSVYIKEPDGATSAAPVNTMEKGHGVEPLRVQAGHYHLAVSATSTASWSVRVDAPDE